MNGLHLSKRMEWLKIGPDVNDVPGSGPEKGFEPIGQRADNPYVSIGDWDYYLHVWGEQIELHRIQQKAGQPSLMEVVKPERFAISADDLDCAVNYWSCGSFESGHYRISPLIERKLRILFE
ncbi:MAG: hypothetical protein HGA55_04360 [Methanoregulaceae archaeon]|nr:hypothetical protein [Methanoregulaceae archaeon]